MMSSRACEHFKLIEAAYNVVFPVALCYVAGVAGCGMPVIMLVLFASKPLRFVQPLARLDRLGVIEITELGFGERFGEDRYSLLPLLFTDHRHALDIVEMVNTELEVFLCRADLPAMKADPVEQDAHLSMLLDELLECRLKVCVIVLY